MQPNRRQSRLLSLAIVAALSASPLTRAAESINTTGTVQNGSGNPAVTISLSGSTAIRNFINSAGATELTPGTSITLSNGPGGADVTYTAPLSGVGTTVQLASKDFTQADTGTLAYPNTSTASVQNNSAIRQEWHEQGSVEGILEMANDQIGYTGGLTHALIDPASRNPTSGNPVRINLNNFTGPATLAGLTLNNANYNTYSATEYNVAGKNLLGGQNRVQMGLSDVAAIQGFSVAGTASLSATPGTAGYGKGNPARQLTAVGNFAATQVNGLGTAGARQQLVDQTFLNMSTDKVNPASGSNYAAGPWNSGGVNNLQNTQVAVTATCFVANPGTGLTKLNRTDAQWLETSGRLQNGADFNMTTRDVNSGTRNVAALNTGVDPSWATGENDTGNGNDLTAGNLAQNQLNIGANLRFSGKTAGGGQLRPTVQNARMAVGTLSLPDTRGAGGTNVIRALDYADSTTDAGATFYPANFANITNGNYVISQNETYVTTKSPASTYSSTLGYTTSVSDPNGLLDPNKITKDAAWLGATDDGRNSTSATGIKGDNTGHDVLDYRNNTVATVTTYTLTGFASSSDPADALLSQGFLFPSLMQKEKSVDGLNQLTTNATFDSTLYGQLSGNSSFTNQFTTLAPNTATAGSGQVYGGAGNNVQGISQGTIAITGQNFLFGNFNQNGVRDFSAVKAALAAAKAVNNPALLNNNMFTGVAGSNNLSAGLTGTLAFATKGDLIVLGDYNSDGIFNGKDIYNLAHGAALTDNTGTDALTTGDYRTGVLLKNAALTYMQTNTADALYVGSTPTNASAQLRTDASANLTNDPKGLNAFNIADTNRDGLIDLNDAFVVDKFSVTPDPANAGQYLNTPQDITNLTNTLAATINSNGSIDPTAAQQKAFNLVDAELTDNKVIDNADTAVVNAQLTGTVNYAWSSTNKVGQTNINISAASGTFTVPAATVLTISNGTFTAGGAADPFTDNTGSATNGNHLSVVNNATLAIAGGTKSVGSLDNGGGALAGTTTVAGGATLNATRVRQGNLTVNGTLNVQQQVGTRNTAATVSVVNSVTVAAAGQLNLNDNDLVIHGGDLPTVQGYLKSGLNLAGGTAGYWSGNGIVSNTAKSDTTFRTTLGAIKNDNGTGGAIYSTVAGNPFGAFDGQNTASTDVLVKYTYYGDADLNGKVNGTDYSQIDNGFNTHLTGWLNGDFNYDGTVDGTDYSLIDNVFNTQGSPLGGSTAALVAGVASEVSGGSTAVPEPGTFSLIGLGTVGMLARRRRKIAACAK